MGGDGLSVFGGEGRIAPATGTITVGHAGPVGTRTSIVMIAM